MSHNSVWKWKMTIQHWQQTSTLIVHAYVWCSNMVPMPTSCGAGHVEIWRYHGPSNDLERVWKLMAKFYTNISCANILWNVSSSLHQRKQELWKEGRELWRDRKYKVERWGWEEEIWVTILTLIYGTAKNNCIGDHSALIRMCKNSFFLRVRINWTCQKQLNSD